MDATQGAGGWRYVIIVGQAELCAGTCANSEDQSLVSFQLTNVTCAFTKSFTVMLTACDERQGTFVQDVRQATTFTGPLRTLP